MNREEVRKMKSGSASAEHGIFLGTENTRAKELSQGKKENTTTELRQKSDQGTRPHKLRKALSMNVKI